MTETPQNRPRVPPIADSCSRNRNTLKCNLELYFVKESMLHIDVDLGDNVSVKIEDNGVVGEILVWFPDQAEEEVCHLTVSSKIKYVQKE